MSDLLSASDGTAPAVVPILIAPKRGLFSTASTVGPSFSITAMATIHEHHMDETDITDHPVQYGATINDHAFELPSVVTLQLGWSNSPNGSITSLSGIAGNDVNGIYTKLLAIKGQRQIFDLYTGKRKYSNMLIKTLITETDFKTANSLPITMTCKLIILVNTGTATFPPGTVLNNGIATALAQGSKSASEAVAKNLNTPTKQ